MNALDLTCGAELERFDLGEVVVNGSRYTVLTGYEGAGGCFWCGGELKGKLKRYCYGHMTLYYNHFNWGYASYEALERAGWRCENCGQGAVGSRDGWGNSHRNLAVHHIVPLKGEKRFFSAFNLPWNLICLCKACHLEIHAVMRGPSHKALVTTAEVAIARGQLVLV